MNRNRPRHRGVWNPPHSNENIERIANHIAEKIAPEQIHHSHTTGGLTSVRTKQLVLRTSCIAIGIPTDEVTFSLFWTNFVTLDVMPWDTFHTTQSTYLPDARNKIHNQFLQTENTTHLLMLDSDVLPPSDYIQRMLAHDKPMVAGWYRKKEKFRVKDLQGNVSVLQRPVVYDFIKSDEFDWFTERMEPKTGLEQVDGAGAGAWLMRRDVAEALGENPYSMEKGGEDLLLCRKVKELCFDVWIDWDTPLAHAGVFFV